jgi:serine/threonine protein kinase/formylglycine-generating enzyme required for sulfatase activity
MLASPNIDEFRLLKLLGRGAMGEVYLAFDALLDRHVAIKLVNSTDQRVRARFYIEARAAARLQHPNVVAVYRVGESAGRLYIVSELVRGRSLDAVEKPLPWREVVELGIHLSRGLACAHRGGVLHRDIKPANAILASGGEVKLIDFGIAKIIAPMTRLLDPPQPAVQTTPTGRPTGDGDLHNEATFTGGLADTAVSPTSGDETQEPSSLTRKDSIIGTPMYLAPEIWQREEATIRSDIYSFGALLFELASGSPPFVASGNMIALARQVTEKGAPSLLSKRSEVDPRFASIVDRCLSKRPEDRFASSDELLDALIRLRSDADARGSPIPAGNPYRGLRAFGAEHHALFFGRQPEIRAVLERMRSDSIVVVAGDSGVGKSSLCRAGVVPMLPRELQDRDWSVVEVVPGRRPLTALIAALSAQFDAIHGDVLWELSKHLGKSKGLVLFVDQLEELVTLAEPAEAARAAEVLGQLAGGLPGVRLISTARSDFLTRIAGLPGLGPEVSRAIYFLPPMSAESVREAIVGPAEVTGVRFESDRDVDLLVNSATGSEGGLPLLQFALAELWELRDVERGVMRSKDLAEVGGVEGALARHADHVFREILPAQQVAARKVVTRLVTSDGTRARLTHPALASIHPEASSAVDALVRGRLVFARAGSEETEYELAHEALIHGWPRLKAWLTKRADQRAVIERVARAAGDWERVHDDELLFGERMIAEVEQLDIVAELQASERAFLERSKRKIRARRIRRWSMAIGAAIAAALIALGASESARREASRKIEKRLRAGSELLSRSIEGHDDVGRLRAEAFRLFDAGKTNEGESNWRSSRRRSTSVSATLAAARRELEGAFAIDSGRADVRGELVRAELLRAEIAERDHAEEVLDDALKRIAEWDSTGSALATWNAPSELTLSCRPSSATARIARYARTPDAPWSLGPWEALGTTPIARRTLSPGSYLVELEAEGFAPVRYPILIGRGTKKEVEIELLESSRVPAGFVYIPAGDFLVGSRSEEGLRQMSERAPPIHPARTEAFLIARRETTYADWIAFLDATQRTDFGRPWPFGLRKVRGAWEAGLRDGGVPRVARQGEPIELLGRRVEWEQLPVDRVSVSEGRRYTAWLSESGRVPGARLCTPFEWERAARGADDRAFPHGERLDPDDAVFRTGPVVTSRFEVGTHPGSRSPFGVDDLIGNAGELVETRRDDSELVRGCDFTCPSNYGIQYHDESPNAPLNTVGLRVCANVR